MISSRKTAPLLVSALVAVAALGFGTGALTPQIAHAQGLNKTNNEAPDRASLGDKIRPSAPVVIAPSKNNGYEATKRTKGGYSVTIQSQTKFGTIIDGNYLFLVTPDGNYLFTNDGGGTLRLSGGWNVKPSGELIDKQGKTSNLDNKPFTTPDGVSVSVGKEGIFTVTMPDKSMFTVRGTMDKKMDPSGLFYD